MSALDEFTTSQIRDALTRALKAGEIEAAVSLLHALAVREPQEATLIAALIYANAKSPDGPA